MFPNPQNPVAVVADHRHLKNWLGRTRDGLDLLFEFATLGEYAGPTDRHSSVVPNAANPDADRTLGYQHLDCPTPVRERLRERPTRRAGQVMVPPQICVYEGDR